MVMNRENDDSPMDLEVAYFQTKSRGCFSTLSLMQFIIPQGSKSIEDSSSLLMIPVDISSTVTRLPRARRAEELIL